MLILWSQICNWIVEGEDILFIAPVLKVIESQATTGYTIYTYQKFLIRQILKVLGNLLKRSLYHKCVVDLWKGGGIS